MRWRSLLAGGAVRCGLLGEVPNSPAAVERLVCKLAGRYGKLHFCYEAGPTVGCTGRSRLSDTIAWWSPRH
jgi:hypothetical protein